MTTKTKRKYVMRTPDPERPGKSWVYFRVRGRPLVRLPDDESSSEFDRQYGLQLAALKGEALRKPNNRTPRKFSNERVAFLPGSLGWFIERYLASSKFDPANRKCFAKGTRYNYRKALDLMKARIGAGLLADVDSEALDVYSAGIEREHGASVADQQINLISNLWDFAKGFKEFKRKGRMNPTLDAKRHYRAGEGHQPWPDEVIERFEENRQGPTAAGDNRFALQRPAQRRLYRHEAQRLQWRTHPRGAGKDRLAPLAEMPEAAAQGARDCAPR